MNPVKLEELERAVVIDMGYIIVQSFAAHRTFHLHIVPLLKKSGAKKEVIMAHANASLESQLLFLRKVNEFFKPLSDGGLQEHDLRAEHYRDYKTPGVFLSREEVTEINRRVGHITLMEVRYSKKDWTPLLTTAQPKALDRLMHFFSFLRDWYQPLSVPTKKSVADYIRLVQELKRILASPAKHK
jgi:hypothetical protein